MLDQVFLEPKPEPTSPKNKERFSKPNELNKKSHKPILNPNPMLNLNPKHFEPNPPLL